MGKWALFSVSDKTGSVELAQWFVDQEIGILASGGTYRHLVDHGIPATPLESITGFEQVLDGRVKTLHPVIYTGILSRRSLADQADVQKIGAPDIVAVVVNLYPFRSQALKAGSDQQALVEEIDIGGVSLIRAAAKNYSHVLVVVNPAQYDRLCSMRWADISEVYRLDFSAEAFRHVAAYDATIAQVMDQHAQPLDADWVVAGIEHRGLRYGENPHQAASFYAIEPKAGFAGARQYQGKELSYNNLADSDAAWGLVQSLPGTAAVVVKHQNPAAAAVSDNVEQAFRLAYEADPISIFGGIVAFNTTVSATVAEMLKDIFLEVVLAPRYQPKALEILSKKKNLRILEMPLQSFKPWEVRMINGGMLVQERDQAIVTFDQFLQVGGQNFDLNLRKEDARLAWATVQWAKSNAIVVVQGGVTVGIGAGQTNRIDAARQALSRAGAKAEGAVLASDAFFPFGDVMEEAAKAKIGVVIQPGGSQRDQESIDLANQTQVPLFFTGERHFRH